MFIQFFQKFYSSSKNFWFNGWYVNTHLTIFNLNSVGSSILIIGLIKMLSHKMFFSLHFFFIFQVPTFRHYSMLKRFGIWKLASVKYTVILNLIIGLTIISRESIENCQTFFNKNQKWKFFRNIKVHSGKNKNWQSLILIYVVIQHPQ